MEDIMYLGMSFVGKSSICTDVDRFCDSFIRQNMENDHKNKFLDVGIQNFH